MEKIKYIGNNLSYIIEKKRTPKCQKKRDYLSLHVF